jgi:hypothetical protein
MVAPARAARVGEHEDTLDVIHECGCLGEACGARTGFDQQPIAPRVLAPGQPRGQALADDAA